MKQVHILTAALAVSLGVNGALIGGGVVAKAAIAKQHCDTMTTRLGAGAKSTVETFVTNNLASAAEAMFGAGVVSLADVKANGITISWSDIGTGEEAATLAAHVCKTGEWVAGEAP
jgi:hypothetical protein